MRVLLVLALVLSFAVTTLGCASAVATGPESAAAAATRAGGLRTGAISSQTLQPQPPANSCHARGRGDFSLPDHRCTPGATDRRVTQRDIASTICRSGYSASVRPPQSITRLEKVASMRAYGDHDSSHNYEYDHLISLELGGAPNAARNLWPEPGGVPNPKDKVENRLHRLVCAGTVSLASAQRQIANDWVGAYRRLIGPTP